MKGMVSALILGVAVLAGASAASAQDIVLGGGYALSLSGATLGEDARAGSDLAAADFNAQGGLSGRKMRIDYDDTQADRAKAVAAYNRFAAQPDVIAFLSISTIELAAIDPIANEAKLPIISVGSAAPLPRFSPWTFRAPLVTARALPVVLKQMKDIKNTKSVSIIYDTANNFTVGEYEVMKTAAPAAGLDFKGAETYTTYDQNYTLQLTRIIATKPDILYVSSIGSDGTLIMSQARALGFTGYFLGGPGLSDPRIPREAGKAGIGAITFFPFDPKDPRPIVQNFVKAYKAKYKNDPSSYSALGYDVVSLVGQAAMKAGKADRDAMRNELGSKKEFEGVSGMYSYDGSGDNLLQRPHLFEYTETGFVPLAK